MSSSSSSVDRSLRCCGHIFHKIIMSESTISRQTFSALANNINDKTETIDEFYMNFIERISIHMPDRIGKNRGK